MRLFLLFIHCFFVLQLLSSQDQDSTYIFRLLLTDKGASPYSIQEPEKFLSDKSIARRQKQGIAIDETDLPISPSYLSEIIKLGVEITAKSKWLQTVSVKTRNYADKERLLALPFADSLVLVYKGLLHTIEEDTLPAIPFEVTAGQTYSDQYGAGFGQIALHNGNLLHEAGFRGEGMTIAVFDGGFHNADKIDAFDTEKILETKNFHYIESHPYRVKVEHGTRVLSCMLSDKENVMVGTAPGASYRLFCTEVDNCEFPVEEDYWIAGMEYADSTGVDIATTSLGYTTFDMKEGNHLQTQLDGESVMMSRAATMAAEKGIFVLNAAGNEGGKAWNTISFPADARHTLTVGAINAGGEAAAFTPAGPTADGRIKPDVVSVGVSTGLIAANGSLVNSNGTSYSTPVVAGLAACLWQALPGLNNRELLELIQRFSSRYAEPDHQYGYGITDFFKAYETTNTSLDFMPVSTTTSIIRHIGTYLYITVDMNDKSYTSTDNNTLTIYNTIGTVVDTIASPPHATFSVNHLLPGMYIAVLEVSNARYSCKFIVR